MTASATSRDRRPVKGFVRLITSEHVVLFLCFTYFVALAPFTEGFASPANFQNILLTLLPLFLLAIGQTVVLITRGIDLSITSTVALASVLGALAMNGENGWFAGSPLAVPAAIVVMLLSGAAIGALNGLAVTAFRMPPFIVTLTTMMFVSGFAVWLTQSMTIGSLPDGFTMIGNSLWIAVPLTMAIALIAHLLLSRSLAGRWLYAAGQNVRAAFISGVPVNGMIVGAYVVSGICGALGSILLTGQTLTGSPVLGQRMLLDVIGATVIGGTSLFGGKGKILWTLSGVLFLKLIDNSLNLLGLSSFTIMIVKGAVILLAALMDAARNSFLIRG